MARYLKRGDNWYVTVSHKGKRYYKTLPTKPAAVAWATQKKAELTSPTAHEIVASEWTVDMLLDRYIKEVHPHRPFARSKMSTIKLTAEHFTDIPISSLTPEHIFQYAERRRAGYKGRAPIGKATLNQQLTYLAQMIEHARTLWGVDLPSNAARDALSALSKIGLVGGSKHRDRRVAPHELISLLEIAEEHRSGWMAPMIRLAVETGMRQSEICELKWEHVDFEASTIFIKDRKHPTEKKGNDQTIPVSEAALDVLREWGIGTAHRGRVFPDVKLASSVSDRFAVVREKAGIEDLHFHDLRHEAISRFFEKGLQIQEVARISGHKDWKQLLRYTQLTAESLVSKLNR